MQEHFDYYTVYFKGHVSQNDDNPAVKHKYMGFQLKLEEWRKKKKILSVSFWKNTEFLLA